MLVRLPSLPLPARKSTYSIGLAAGTNAPFVCRYGSTDFVMLSEIFISGEYEQAATVLENSGSAIVDLGANAGFSVRYWGDKFPNSRVFAVEPDPSNILVCRMNVEIAGMGSRTTLLEGAVVGKPGAVFLDNSSDECSFHVSNDGNAGMPVAGFTLGDILSRFDAATRVDLLKCDIEGAEAEVFRNCSRWIRRFRYLVVETHPPYTMHELVGDLEANGASPEPISLREKERGLGLALIRLGPT